MTIWTEEEKSELWRLMLSGDTIGQTDYGPIIREVADKYSACASVTVKFTDIIEFNPKFADYVLANPEEAISLGEGVIETFLHADQKDNNPKFVMRITDVPSTTKVEIGDIRAAHMGRLVTIEALVRRVTDVRPRMTEAVFRCQRCTAETTITQTRKEFKEPLFCARDTGGCARAATATRFVILKNKSKFVDFQNIVIQEYPEGLRGGAQAHRYKIHVEGDLAGKVFPGDRVIFTGIIQSRQLYERGNTKSDLFETFMDCRGISRAQDDYEEISISPDDERIIRMMSCSPELLSEIVHSIAPSIQGMEEVKLALALQLFGGVRKEIEEGHLRGDIHILLVGDPGTAKSQMLNYIQKMSPRGVSATGKSASAAGLTAAAVPDEHEKGRWNLEAGALVLADRGTACIDEIDKMNPNDRSSMHEAMEQQTVTITKAGIQATLQSRCAVLAAANPKLGRFSGMETLMEEVNMPLPLLDRFDMIFTIKDEPNPHKDGELAEHVVNTHQFGEMKKHRELKPYGDYTKEDVKRASENLEPFHNHEILKKYIAYAKKNVFPVMTAEAKNKIVEYYIELRGKSRDGVISCTARQLEGIIRFSEACARAHLTDTVTEKHVEIAKGLIGYYLDKEAPLETGGIDRVVCSTTHSQRASITIILGIIRKLESEVEEYERSGVPEEEIISECENENISEQAVVVTLENLSHNRMIYKPRSGKYKIA